ncbi:MAG: hypothetical protein IPK82_16170 [Polyangiaceae bacterium]|nr:hypothetical protein [Polyangiaceae bacterium]
MRLLSWATTISAVGLFVVMGCSDGGPSEVGGGGTGGSGAAGGTGGGAGGDVTWTSLYNTVFGPNGTSNCAANGGCHTAIQNGFKCGTTKTACYDGMVAAGLILTGADAPNSRLVDPDTSPLCGTLGATMPNVGKCVTDAQIDKIKSWLNAGAPNN